MMIDQVDHATLLNFRSWRGTYPETAIVRCDDDPAALELNTHNDVTCPLVIWFDTKERRIYVKKHGDFPFSAEYACRMILGMKGVYQGVLSHPGEQVAGVSGIDPFKAADALPHITIIHRLAQTLMEQVRERDKVARLTEAVVEEAGKAVAALQDFGSKPF